MVKCCQIWTDENKNMKICEHLMSWIGKNAMCWSMTEKVKNQSRVNFLTSKSLSWTARSSSQQLCNHIHVLVFLRFHCNLESIHGCLPSSWECFHPAPKSISWTKSVSWTKTAVVFVQIFAMKFCFCVRYVRYVRVPVMTLPVFFLFLQAKIFVASISQNSWTYLLLNFLKTP